MVEFWNFRNFSILVVDELHENPFTEATILLVELEFGVLVLLELLGVRDEKLSRNTLR